jgi:hypothetical protein
MMSKKAEQKAAGHLFYAFVWLTANSHPTYYVVPRNVVADYITKSHKRWLKKPRRDGGAHRDSSLRRFRDRESRFKNAWNLLGLD